jgi:hypothetical protein
VFEKSKKTKHKKLHIWIMTRPLKMHLCISVKMIKVKVPVLKEFLLLLFFYVKYLICENKYRLKVTSIEILMTRNVMDISTWTL